MKKIKIGNYSQEKFITKLESSELLEKFEITDLTDLSVKEIVAKKLEVIEIAPNDFETFKDYAHAIDWKTNLVGIADALILQGGKYRPVNLQVEALIMSIKKNSKRINSQLPVIVIGDFHFVFSTVAKLAMSGFVEIIYSISDGSNTYSELVEKKVKAFVFNLNLRAVNINELTTSDLAGALLVCDFKKSTNKDAYELLTYFNFLLQGALFIDCNSINDSFLVEDARKAEIAVVDEREVITQKYFYLLEKLKISP
jgi:hypothetical protein